MPGLEDKAIETVAPAIIQTRWPVHDVIGVVWTGLGWTGPDWFEQG